LVKVRLWWLYLCPGELWPRERLRFDAGVAEKIRGEEEESAEGKERKGNGDQSSRERK
jgi:hypothetical protein